MGRVCRLRPVTAARALDCQPGLRSPARKGRRVSPWESGGYLRQSALDGLRVPLQPQCPGHPFKEESAVAERAAHDEAAPVGPIAPQSPWNRRPARLAHDSHGARRAHHQGQALGRATAAAHVAAGPVSNGGHPGNSTQVRPAIGEGRAEARQRSVEVDQGGQLVPLQRQHLQNPLVPLQAVLIQQSRPRRHGEAAAVDAEKFQIGIFPERHPPGSPAEQLRTGPIQPQQLGRQVTGMERASRAGVVSAFVYQAAKFLRGGRAAGVGPGVDRGQRPTLGAHPHQVVPKGRHGDGGDPPTPAAASQQDLVDRLHHQLEQGIGAHFHAPIRGGCELVGSSGLQAVHRTAATIVDSGPNRGTPGVNGENQRVVGLHFSSRPSVASATCEPSGSGPGRRQSRRYEPTRPCLPWRDPPPSGKRRR